MSKNNRNINNIIAASLVSIFFIFSCLMMGGAIYSQFGYIEIPANQKIVILSCENAGTGNQLFRYAAAKTLADRIKAQLWIVKWRFNFEKSSNDLDFHLDEFEIIPDKWITLIQLEYIMNYNKYFHVNEQNFFSIDGNEKSIYILRGDSHKNKDYVAFEAIKFFQPIQNQMAELTFANSLAENELTNKIIHSESVGVHVRRGDFIKDKRLIPLTYQVQAMQKILELLPNAHFFIFSDDPSFVQSAFVNLKNLTIASKPEHSSIDELQLMSMCKHNIIANSTFSWWAAYLNKNSNKTVIAPDFYAPKSFFTTDGREKFYQDYFALPEWIKLNPFLLEPTK